MFTKCRATLFLDYFPRRGSSKSNLINVNYLGGTGEVGAETGAVVDHDMSPG